MLKKGKYLQYSLWIISLFWALAALAAPQGQQVTIAGGRYFPFYRLGTQAQSESVLVKSYAIDVYPVTHRDFLTFVKANPQWRKQRVKSIFADQNYLKHWSQDLRFPSALANTPVNYVSWFAARAYCKAQGKRLPTVDQWEFAALADATRKDASKDPAFHAQILKWYGRPTPEVLPAVGQQRNVYGVYDLHGLVWEWNRDFNSVLITGESREDSGGVNRGLYCAGGASAGADPSDYASYMRYAFRSSLSAAYTVKNLGFRCVKEY